MGLPRSLGRSGGFSFREPSLLPVLPRCKLFLMGLDFSRSYMISETEWNWNLKTGFFFL